MESIPNFPPGRNSASGELPFLDHWDQQDSVRPPGTTSNQWADATPLQGQPEATRGPRSLQVVTRGNSSLTLASHSRACSTMRKSSTCLLPQASWQSSGKAETQMRPSWRFPCSLVWCGHYPHLHFSLTCIFRLSLQRKECNPYESRLFFFFLKQGTINKCLKYIQIDCLITYKYN